MKTFHAPALFVVMLLGSYSAAYTSSPNQQGKPERTMKSIDSGRSSRSSQASEDEPMTVAFVLPGRNFDEDDTSPNGQHQEPIKKIPSSSRVVRHIDRGDVIAQKSHFQALTSFFLGRFQSSIKPWQKKISDLVRQEYGDNFVCRVSGETLSINANFNVDNATWSVLPSDNQPISSNHQHAHPGHDSSEFQPKPATWDACIEITPVSGTNRFNVACSTPQGTFFKPCGLMLPSMDASLSKDDIQQGFSLEAITEEDVRALVSSPCVRRMNPCCFMYRE